jgi:hypothetical protein
MLTRGAAVAAATATASASSSSWAAPLQRVVVLCRAPLLSARAGAAAGAGASSCAPPSLPAVRYTSSSAGADAGASSAGASSAGASSSSSTTTTIRAKSRLAVADAALILPESIDAGSLRDLPGSKKRTRRKGRGVGSGHGLARSAGEGSKGQKSHEAGGISYGFEGGQSPLWRRTPKIGVARPRMLRRETVPVNLAKLQLWIDTGKIDTAE